MMHVASAGVDLKNFNFLVQDQSSLAVKISGRPLSFCAQASHGVGMSAAH